MLKTKQVVESNEYTVDRFEALPKVDAIEKVFSGKIKGIAIPLSLHSYDKNNELEEICCYFSLLEAKGDYSEEIHKQFRKLHKYGKYAPHTHLIPQ